ncbi:MAG: hypothetical protein EXR34_03810 [Rhodoferax sp.]|nr:hypothetical protein [Rhodoferax sp.]
MRPSSLSIPETMDAAVRTKLPRHCVHLHAKPSSTISAESMPVTDSYTDGEPTRLVVAGGPDLGCGSLAQRRRLFANEHNNEHSS